jgi:hypothetical protein
MTYKLYENAGGWNGNFLMMVPSDTLRPTLSQVYPDGSAMFQRTNILSFVVSSSHPIDTSLVSLTLNGTAASNLVFGGQPTNLIVSYSGLQPDTAYTANVSINTTNNDPCILSYRFDTFGPAYYTFEAEDWDYNSGNYINNPAVDAYASLAGVDGIDAHNASGGGTAYRSNDAGDLGNEVTGDVLRAQFVASGTNDYDIGWTAAGQWANYTRTYPTGVFNIFMRVASPSGQEDAASLLRVTSGLGTSSQTTVSLGTFNAPATGGYQTWGWTPLVDTNGSSVIVTNSGSVSTFRMSEDNGGWNANFFMFVPAPATVPKGPPLTITLIGGKATISFPMTNGSSYQIQYKNKLSDPIWTPLGSPVSTTGSAGSVQDTITGTGRFYRAAVQ